MSTSSLKSISIDIKTRIVTALLLDLQFDIINILGNKVDKKRGTINLSHADLDTLFQSEFKDLREKYAKWILEAVYL